MEEILKTRIEITDEGVIYIDNLTADYGSFDETLEKYAVYVVISSKEGYEKMKKGYIDYLTKHKAVKDIHSKIDYLDYLYKAVQAQAEDIIAYSFKTIKAAARILGMSELEIYKHNVELLKKNHHD